MEVDEVYGRRKDGCAFWEMKGIGMREFVRWRVEDELRLKGGEGL
jgi:hypothetical protein